MKCDCLNDCGDDPWLKDGRSQPCARLAEVRRRAALREHINIMHAAFDAAGVELTIRYTVPLNPEQQAMVLSGVS